MTSFSRAITYFFLALASVLVLGCQPSIGDSCNTGTDCSVNGDRVCDIAQPDGYCTVRGCDPDSCPGSSICVEFRGDPDRLAETWCMDRCKKESQCRRADGYTCLQPSDPLLADGNGDPIAEILDEVPEEVGFCIATGSN